MAAHGYSPCIARLALSEMKECCSPQDTLTRRHNAALIYGAVATVVMLVLSMSFYAAYGFLGGELQHSALKTSRASTHEIYGQSSRSRSSLGVRKPSDADNQADQEIKGLVAGPTKLLRAAMTAVANRQPKAIALAVAAGVVLLAAIAAVAVLCTVNLGVAAPSQGKASDTVKIIANETPLVLKYLSYWLPPVAVVVCIATALLLWWRSKVSTLCPCLVQERTPAQCYEERYPGLADYLPDLITFDSSEAELDDYLNKKSIEMFGDEYNDQYAFLFKNIFLVADNITQVPVDAVVNPCNQRGTHGSGVSASITASIGLTGDGKSALVKISDSLSRPELFFPYPVMTARAVAVPNKDRGGTELQPEAGYKKLNPAIKMIIQATGPRPGQEPRYDLLRSAIYAALRKANERGSRSLAIPCFGTGQFSGKGSERFHLVVLDTIKDWWRDNVNGLNHTLKKIVIVAVDPAQYVLYGAVLLAAFRADPPAKDFRIDEQNYQYDAIFVPRAPEINIVKKNQLKKKCFN